MNKLFFIIGALLALVACSKQVPKATTYTLVKPEACQQVYQHMVEMAVNESINTDGYMGTAQYEAACNLTDLEWVMNGKKDRFFNMCVTQMSRQQFYCFMFTHRLDQLNDCVRFIPSARAIK